MVTVIHATNKDLRIIFLTSQKVWILVWLQTQTFELGYISTCIQKLNEQSQKMCYPQTIVTISAPVRAVFHTRTVFAALGLDFVAFHFTVEIIDITFDHTMRQIGQAFCRALD